MYSKEPSTLKDVQKKKKREREENIEIIKKEKKLRRK